MFHLDKFPFDIFRLWAYKRSNAPCGGPSALRFVVPYEMPKARITNCKYMDYWRPTAASQGLL